MMKCFIAIAFLALFIPTEANVDVLCNEISRRILQTLASDSVNLTELNFTDQGYLQPALNATVVSIKSELAVDNQSIECEIKSTDIVSVSFNIFIRDFSIESDLSVLGYGRRTKTAAHVRSLGMGNVTLATQAFFANKSKTLVVKNVPTSYVQYINDFDWADTTPAFDSIRKEAEQWVETTFKTLLPAELNFRVHKIIYSNVSNITKGLPNTLGRRPFQA